MRFAVVLLAAVVLARAGDHGEYFSTSSGPFNITLVHHASLVIEGAGRVVYVDPTSEGNYKGLPKADLVLITNDLPDHLDMAAINRCSRKSTAVIAPASAAGRLQHCTALNNGETVSVGEIVVEAEPAYQATAGTDGAKPAHPKGQGNGYVLTYPGVRVYISGDTGFYPEMKALKNIDIAFLSMGTPDTMSLEEAAKAVRTIRPKILYPYAYRDTNQDEIRKQLATPEVEVRVRNWY
jgi:L-ascorbate metabolism protein UlaG (beta-lactamase superfamily)